MDHNNHIELTAYQSNWLRVAVHCFCNVQYGLIYFQLGEIEIDKLCFNGKFYSIDEKNSKLPLQTFENILQKTRFLRISGLSSNH